MSTSGTPPLAPSATAAAARRPRCAACKEYNRQCSEECVLAPYSGNMNDINNVHRLFKISRVAALLENLPPHKRDAAARSIIYEANYCAKNPAGGCYAVVKELRRLVQLGEAELKMVQKNLREAKSILQGSNEDPLFYSQEANPWYQKPEWQQLFNYNPTLRQD